MPRPPANPDAEHALYAIRNTLDGTPLIGVSSNIKRRWLMHRTALRKKRHWNVHLQRAWNRDSEQAFLFEVICIGDKDYIYDLEQRYIDLKKQGVKLYNISDGGVNPGVSVEARAKISAKRKGHKDSKVNAGSFVKGSKKQGQKGGGWNAGRPAWNKGSRGLTTRVWTPDQIAKAVESRRQTRLKKLASSPEV